MTERTLSLTLRIWRQTGPADSGAFESYQLHDLNPEMSFPELLDQLNQQLTEAGAEPVAFDSDCREGICGMCGAVIDGLPHGPERGSTLCQLHLRSFQDGQTITVEPFHARAFPILKDLLVDRSALDRIIQAGGFISVNTGSAPEANALPVSQHDAEQAMDAAACIGCGACVAACPNAAAMLFTAAKLTHLVRLPQGQAERRQRVLSMAAALDTEGFGACSNHRQCESVCPKGISLRNIALLNREYLWAVFNGED